MEDKLILEEQYKLVTDLIKDMLDGIVEKNIDLVVEEIEKVAPQLSSEGFAKVIMLHSLNRLFFRSTQLILIILRHVESSLGYDEEITHRYIDVNIKYALKKYDEVWDAMIKVIPYKNLKHDLYTFIRVEEAYADKEALTKLIDEMPSDLVERYEYITKTAFDKK